MEMSEAIYLCEKLRKTTLEYWNAKRNNDNFSASLYQSTYSSIWKTIIESGYKIRKHRIHTPWTMDESLGCRTRTVKEIQYIPYIPNDNPRVPGRRSQKNQGAELVIFNANPNGKSAPDCTTRAMAYCLKNQLTYDQIRAEQNTISKEIYGDEDHWNFGMAWGRCLLNRGYKKIYLSRNLTRATIAKRLSFIKNPMVTVSRGHAAAIDQGKVIDTWNSRGGRVKFIYVKSEDYLEVANTLKDTVDRSLTFNIE